MTRILLLITTSIAFVHSLNNLLVQGRADTLRVLRKIIKEREGKIIPLDVVGGVPIVAWEPTVSRDAYLRRFNSESSSEESDSRRRRHISNAVIESGDCEHIDLMDCSEFESEEMTCMLTATGMTCCVCTGQLKNQNKWNFL